MSYQARWILAIAALFILPAFFLPIWSITLVAPQYPDGIGMHIWLYQVTGHEQHDIQNINILNHYIGMKPIVQEEFWEFDVMPYVFGALMGLGLLAAAIGRRWMLWGWIGLFVLISIGGLADFYYWGYQYGHDLDPTAPIRVDDLTYQPPLIGSKQLLNITAHSWPTWGGFSVALSMLIGFAAAFVDFRQSKQEKQLTNA